MNSEAAEAVAGSLGAKAVYGGGGVAVFGGLTSHDVIGLLGLAVALIGGLISWYYKRKADKRAEALHQLREDYIRRGRRTDTDLGELGLDE